MKGHFTSHYLAEVLRDIFLQERSGVLTLESSSGPRTTIRFDRGMFVDADSPAGAATLAAALRDEGIVSAEILLDTVPDCSTAPDLAAALTSKGAITPEGLATGMKGLIRRALSDAFSWQGGTFDFQDVRQTSATFTPDVLFTFESIVAGVATMSNFEPLKEVLLNLPGRLRMSENMFLPVHRLALKPHHGFVLSRIDGSITMKELAQVVPSDAVDDALKFAYGLAVFGVIIIDPSPSSEAFSLREIMPAHHESRARSQREETLIRETLLAMSGQAPEKVLGVEPGSTKEALKAAFDERRARFRRDRFAVNVRESMKRELDMIEAKLTEAFFGLELSTLESEQRAARTDSGIQTVSEDELLKRREFSKTEAQATQEQNARLSEKYFTKAREYFRDNDFYNCIQFCRLAIKFNSESAASYQLMGETLARNPDRRWQRQAEEAYVKATELDPFNVELFVAVGLFYKEQGLDSRARKMFEKALKILPAHATAARELKSLGR